MVGTLLGFGGRIGRLSYFLWSLALGIVATVVLCTIVLGAMSGGGKGPSYDAFVRSILVALLVVGLPALWFSLALQAKRIRDIGWNPAIVLPLWIGTGVVDRVIGALLDKGAGGTGLGIVVNLAMSAVLLFWPGAGSGAADWPGEYHEVEPLPRATVRVPAVAREPAMARVVTPTPQPAARAAGFGRRGLS